MRFSAKQASPTDRHLERKLQPDSCTHTSGVIRQLERAPVLRVPSLESSSLFNEGVSIMGADSTKDQVSRRDFMGIGSAALVAAVGVLSTVDASAEDGKLKVDASSDRSRSDPGPTNAALDGQNPNSNVPPATDEGSVQTFKYPFSLSQKRLHEGGWSRQVTVRELPVSKAIAGVDMRLTAGGVREL